MLILLRVCRPKSCKVTARPTDVESRKLRARWMKIPLPTLFLGRISSSLLSHPPLSLSVWDQLRCCRTKHDRMIDMEVCVANVWRKNIRIKMFKQIISFSKIWGFHGDDYEECHLLGCGAVYILCDPTFRRNVDLHKIYTEPHLRRRHSSISFSFIMNWKMGDLRPASC
jgi:hypothetical protein